MGTTDIALERIFKQLISGNVGMAIAEVETYLVAWPNPQTAEKLQTVKAEYELMADYWQRGAKDPQRDEHYQRLLQRVYVLSANISIHRHVKSSSYLSALSSGARQPGRSWTLDAIRHEMEGFVSDVAMLELEPEGQRQEKSGQLYKAHQQQMNQLFNYVVTSHVWTDGIATGMEELLLSPTVDSNDQQLLVSAIMLSLMNRFDMAKFRLLVDVYRRSQDEQVRQRALVGWVLSIDDDFRSVWPEQQQLVTDLLQSKRVCRELTELQMQLVYALDSEKDTTTIRDEILPEFMKNNNFRITKDGIKEVEDDPMEDILHPGASEERMERLEATFQRMTDMQKRGVDVYFGGFSQMKRYPFFYDMSNWLVPFFMQHPDISQYVQRLGDNPFIAQLLQQGAFCNSDKYSLLMAFLQVMDQLPKDMVKLMKSGEAVMDHEMNAGEQQSPEYLRHSYLMDLYRFFRLFPNRSALCNPFDTSKDELGMCLFIGSALFHGTPMEQSKREVVAMLRKRHLYTSAETILATFPEEMRDVQYHLWRGEYAEALRLEPDNERALSGQARVMFNAGDYEDALEYYDRLQLLHPDKTGYVLNKAVCLLHLEEYDDALKLLYQLNYEHEEDDNVRRVLAWTLTCSGKLEQAERLYVQLTEGGQAQHEDYQNYGYCLWLSGRIAEAVGMFRKYVELSKVAADDRLFFDEGWLMARGISDIDIRMMTAAVKN